MSILFTNRKLRSIHSESVPRRRSKASTYSDAEKLPLPENFGLCQPAQSEILYLDAFRGLLTKHTPYIINEN